MQVLVAGQAIPDVCFREGAVSCPDSASGCQGGSNYTSQTVVERGRVTLRGESPQHCEWLTKWHIGANFADLAFPGFGGQGKSAVGRVVPRMQEEL